MKRTVPYAQLQNDDNAALNENLISTSDDDADDDMACFATGTEVTCLLPDEDDSFTASTRSSTQGKSNSEEGFNVLEALLLISPFFFWGTSMVAMKQLAPHTTPLFVAAWRLIPAGFALLLWAKASGRKSPNSAMGWFAVSLFALADGACFQGFLAEGLQRTSAGLGSVIIDSQPLTVALLASLLFGERLGVAGYVGLLVGVGGLLLLEVPPSALQAFLGNSADAGISSSGGGGDAIIELASTSSSAITTSIPSSSSDWSIWDSGEWWMLLAAQSMAVGTVMVRWVAKYCDPVAATGWHMIIGGVPLLALAFIQEGDTLAGNLAQLNTMDGLLLIYVSLLGSAASYGVFFYEATVRGNLTALSSLTFLTPMFAAAGGYVVLGETLTPLQLVGAGITLGAVYLISSGGRSSNNKKKDVDVEDIA